MAALIHHLNERQVVLAAHIRIVFTKGGSYMNDTGTVCHGNVFVAYYIEALFLLLIGGCLCAFV